MTKMLSEEHPSDIQDPTAVKTQVQCSADSSDNEYLSMGSGLDQAILQMKQLLMMI